MVVNLTVSTLYHYLMVPATDAWHSLPEFSAQTDVFKTIKPGDDVLYRLTADLHYHNLSVWHHEDYARTDDPTTIVNAKRGIDRHNQLRNDAIENLDRHFASTQIDDPRAIFITDTPGSLIDRLSVINLKLYHVAELLAKDDQTPSLINKLRDKLFILSNQRDYLLRHGDWLVNDLKKGRKCFVIFEQHKLYNDPTTNPKMAKP